MPPLRRSISHSHRRKKKLPPPKQLPRQATMRSSWGDIGSDTHSADFDRGPQSTAAENKCTNRFFPRRQPAPLGLGYIVARLWEQRTEGSELEIFLSEGRNRRAPISFPSPYRPAIMVFFAIQESDGSFAVSVIPWNTVRRVGLRRMADLSGDLFQ